MNVHCIEFVYAFTNENLEILSHHLHHLIYCNMQGKSGIFNVLFVQSTLCMQWGKWFIPEIFWIILPGVSIMLLKTFICKKINYNFI